MSEILGVKYHVSSNLEYITISGSPAWLQVVTTTSSFMPEFVAAWSFYAKCLGGTTPNIMCINVLKVTDYISSL